MGIKLNRLRAYRVLNDKTQPEMAQILDMCLTSYCAREQGKVDFTSSEIGVIANTFGIDPGELYRDTNTLT